MSYSELTHWDWLPGDRVELVSARLEVTPGSAGTVRDLLHNAAVLLVQFDGMQRTYLVSCDEVKRIALGTREVGHV